jgi:hypothetical protein
MQSRIRAWVGVLACAVAACGHLEANEPGERAARKAPPVPRQEAGTQPLPTITIEGRAPTRYALHTAGDCRKKNCDVIFVTVDANCHMDLDPQWLGLGREVDWFVLTYELSSKSVRGATLTAIHEKGSSVSNPMDLFHKQKVLGGGKSIVVDDVANHFIGVKHSVIEASIGDRACPGLDPPVIPDY